MEKSNLVLHAEVETAYMRNGDPMSVAMADHLVMMAEAFSKEGHSGFSASYAVNALERLLRFEPLRPLTGADDEWVDHGYVMQNKRCSHVFKDNTGAYDSTGLVFRDADGSCYTNRDSRVYIAFPYTPKIEYIDREAE